jgi:hypothetical protein
MNNRDRSTLLRLQTKCKVSDFVALTAAQEAALKRAALEFRDSRMTPEERAAFERLGLLPPQQKGNAS